MYVSHHAEIADRFATAAVMHDVCGHPHARAWPHTTWVVQASFCWLSVITCHFDAWGVWSPFTYGRPLVGAVVITVNSDYTRSIERLMVNSHGVAQKTVWIIVSSDHHSLTFVGVSCLMISTAQGHVN